MRNTVVPAKLVNITQQFLGCLVDLSTDTWGYKPTYNWAPPILGMAGMDGVNFPHPPKMYKKTTALQKDAEKFLGALKTRGKCDTSWWVEPL